MSMVYDLIPTSTGLHRIRLVDTEDCTLCGKQDTTIHRLTECGVGEEMWEWTLYGWRGNIERTGRAFHLAGSWGPVSDFGHDNDICQRCGS